ncbi:MAG: tyrosine-type recombinase/integrase [Nitrososphaerota archaeon]
MPLALNNAKADCSIRMDKGHKHRSHEDRLKIVLDKLEDRVGKRNAALIRSFIGFLRSEGIGPLRMIKYIHHMVSFARIVKKALDKVNESDVRAALSSLEEKGYSDWTKHDYKVAVRRFYKWLRDNDNPPEVSWIKIKSYGKCKLPEELLTEEEVKLMASKATNLRDKAFVLVLYESGARIGEMLGLKIKNVTFDEYGAAIIVSGKTGMRRIRIVASAPMLAEWLDNHPLRNDPDAPLWIGLWTKNYLKPLDYPAVAKMLKTLAKRAGIKKRIYPHLFRHSRASHLANILTEAQMKEYFGWKQDSEMAAVYVHLSGRDLDKALLRASGMPIEEDLEVKEFRLIMCQRCKEQNSPGISFCRRCGAPLDLKVALELDEKKNSEIAELKDMMKELCKLITVIGEAYLNDEDGSIRQRCGHLIKECLPLLREYMYS